ncbi:hypothetical protein [Thermodesulforhabdus norvegica]|uniref:Uncharacterized protein n=1 Tax=Thermodesulforhabdus norvegica TaxID=39841 RepID=A0A1I4SEL1_9BACT|nr:hypothetical protein [Thermodesulforhabdus norvegica]SFM62897.1 hypothetical protein SAMN05660836_00922 [Thermodesulforhabdus norvegica]
MERIKGRLKRTALGFAVLSLLLGVWVSFSEAGRYGSMSRSRSYQDCPYYNGSTGRHMRFQYDGNYKRDVTGNRQNFQSESGKTSQDSDNY